MLNIPIKDHFRETRIFNSRLLITGVGVAILCLLLLSRLVYLQLISHQHYATLSQANRVRPEPIPPVRGLILDRNGVVLAQNYPVYTLEIIPEQTDNLDQVLTRLKRLITLSPKDLKTFNKNLKRRPRFESILLRTHLSDKEAARVAIELPYLYGVQIKARLQRHYPLGALGVHATGYVARIGENDMKRIDTAAYRGTQHIGKLGVEQSYESLLFGKVGIENNEVNARGRRLRTIERIPAQAGKNIYLNIDAKLQSVAERALGNRRGAVVALDPITGAVLTFASTPTYNPNPFVNGIDNKSFKALLENPDKPLINRALNGQYAPGSTIKPFLGLAGLESGTIEPESTVLCKGAYSLPGDKHRFRDWKRGGHGEVALLQAIAQSCDVFFYRLAVRMGINKIESLLLPFGFGKKTGIDLYGESLGLLATPAWKQARGEKWYPGETVMAGIGQGLVLTTPLQLASAVATLANGGVRMKPRLLSYLEDPSTHVLLDNVPTAISKKQVLNKEHLNLIIASMTEVVHGKLGTGRRISHNLNYRIAGKTGTSQVKSIAQTETYDRKNTPERLRDHALFIAFAPVEAPRIAVAVIVENGGHGSTTAAPIARQLMDSYLVSEDKS